MYNFASINRYNFAKEFRQRLNAHFLKIDQRARHKGVQIYEDGNIRCYQNKWKRDPNL